MSIDILMPNLGFDTQEAQLVEWKKQVGDSVQPGEVLAVIGTDKTDMDLTSVAGGVVLELLCANGSVVPVGTVIARVGDVEAQQTATSSVPAGSDTPASSYPASPVAVRLAAEHNVDLTNVAGSGLRGRVMRNDVETVLAHGDAVSEASGQHSLRALPKVRLAARRAGIDLAAITGTGVLGAVTLADLEAFQSVDVAPALSLPDAADSSPLPAGATEQPLGRMRRAVGKRLGDSMRDAPHFYVTGVFDVEAAWQRLRTLPSPQPRVNDLIQYLTVQALRQAPVLNAIYQRDRLMMFESVNLAIAVALDDGLITPVLHNAERLSLVGMAAASRALVERARANQLGPEDLQGGTFTVSNLGVVRQVEEFTAVINPPQVAILAVGAVTQRPFVIDGGLYVRQTVHLTLSGDHRVVDGMHLARFLAAFQAELDSFSKGTGKS